MNKTIKLIHLITVILIGCFLSTTGCKKEEELDREKYLGDYSAVQTCDLTNDLSYTISITESDVSEDAVLITDFYNFNKTLDATILKGTITIPSQTISGLEYSGAGDLSDNTLSINFFVSNGVQNNDCFATCTRK